MRFHCLLSVALCSLAFIAIDTDSSFGQSSSRGSTTRVVPQNSQFRSQGSTTSQGSVTRSSRTRAPFERRFWDYLTNAKYKNWAPVPGQSDGMYEGQSPHGAYLKMYLNRRAAGNPQELPNGSVVVKENYGPDRKTLMAITAMYRSTGYNSEAGDWFWVKYRPDGTVDRKSTPNGAVRLAGKVKGCIECHSQADGDDYSFFNDN